MRCRLSELRRLARQRGCTHILVSDVIDVHYISGFESTNAYLLVSSRGSLLFTDFRYRSAAQRFCRSNRPWRFVEMGENSFAVLGCFLKQGDRVGIQSDTLTVRQYDLLRHHCTGVRFAKLGSAVADVSLVKSGPEIRAMDKAARIGSSALRAFTGRLSEGMTEKNAARLLESLCAERGSAGPSFPTIVLFGARSALPHGHPSGRTLRKGDLVLVDFGCRVDGFCSDMTRTLVFGSVGPNQRKIYQIVQKAQDKARRAVRGGVTVAHIDKLARDWIAGAGYAEYFGHATGHGLGRRIHEKPRVSQHDRTVLRPNMVVTVEPGIYVPRLGGVRIEDTVVVTRDGSRLLTRFSRDLMEIPA